MPKVRARLEVVKGTKQRPYPREMRHGRLLVVDGMTRKNNRRGPEGVCPKGGTMTPDEKRIVEWLEKQSAVASQVSEALECYKIDGPTEGAHDWSIRWAVLGDAADCIRRGDHRKD